MIIHCVAISGTGKRRKDNQDNFFMDGFFISPFFHVDTVKRDTLINDSQLHIFAVADGMGGESFGDLASYIAVKNMNTVEEKSYARLTEYIRSVNLEICEEILCHDGLRMGSTLAMVAVENAEATILNIGDSRIYLYRSGKLSQVSIDHTSVGQMIKMGILSEEQRKNHPRGHELTQHLGIFEDEMVIEPYIISGSFISGDIALLCSDGLTDMLDNAEIENILGKEISLDEKEDMLFNAAMEAGGKDNITAMLIGFSENY